MDKTRGCAIFVRTAFKKGFLNNFMGTDLKKVADYLSKAGKETYYIAERR